MTPKHTPGPWHKGSQPHNCKYIFSETGRMRLEEDGTTLYPVAQTIDFNGEGVANARLIAAAPELLEACKNLLWHFDPEHKTGRTTLRTDEVQGFTEQAIAKAEGK